MRTVELNNVRYEYTYTSDDIYDIIAIAATGNILAAAKRCTKLLRHVEDNETNAMLRFKLGNLVMGDMNTVLGDIDTAKNSPSPSDPQKP
jgi:hypothetical protein